MTFSFHRIPVGIDNCFLLRGERTTLTVGRATDNDVCIEDPTITSHHLQVTVSGDMFRVETVDLNASFAQRGQVVQHAVLGPSTITVGRFLLRLKA